MKYQILQKTEVEKRHDGMLMRVSQDGNHVALLFHKHTLDKGNMEVRSLKIDDERPLHHIRKPPMADWTNFITPIFDVSFDGKFVALTIHDTANLPTGYDGMKCFLYNVPQREYTPHFIKHNLVYKSYITFGRDAVKGYDLLECRFLDDFRLATVTVAGEVFVWNYIKQSLIFSWTAASHRANSVAFTHKFGFFALAESNLDYVRGGWIGKFGTQDSQIIYRDPDDGHIISEPLQIGAFLRLWDIHSGTVVREFECDRVIHKLVFSPDDSLLAGYDTEAQITTVWIVTTGQFFQIEGKLIGFTSDGNLLLYEKNTIKLWDVQAKHLADFAYDTSEGFVDCKVTRSDKLVILYKTLNDWQIQTVQLEI